MIDNFKIDVPEQITHKETVEILLRAVPRNARNEWLDVFNDFALKILDHDWKFLTSILLLKSGYENYEYKKAFCYFVNSKPTHRIESMSKLIAMWCNVSVEVLYSYKKLLGATVKSQQALKTLESTISNAEEYRREINAILQEAAEPKFQVENRKTYLVCGTKGIKVSSKFLKEYAKRRVDLWAAEQKYLRDLLSSQLARQVGVIAKEFSNGNAVAKAIFDAVENKGLNHVLSHNGMSYLTNKEHKPAYKLENNSYKELAEMCITLNAKVLLPNSIDAVDH